MVGRADGMLGFAKRIDLAEAYVGDEAPPRVCRAFDIGGAGAYTKRAV